MYRMVERFHSKPIFVTYVDASQKYKFIQILKGKNAISFFDLGWNRSFDTDT